METKFGDLFFSSTLMSRYVDVFLFDRKLLIVYLFLCTGNSKCNRHCRIKRHIEMSVREAAINEINKLSLPERVMVVEEVWSSIFKGDNYPELSKEQYTEFKRKISSNHPNYRQRGSRDELKGRLEKIDSLKRNFSGFMEIHRLSKHNLYSPLWVVVEPDDGGFIARCVDLPLYGYGDDVIEAVGNLKFEIESLYEDLMEDDNFTEDWLKIKAFLRSKVMD